MRVDLMKRKYDIRIDGYSIRNLADFNRIDLSRSQRRKYHRKLKLIKKDIIRDAVISSF